jgi:hypothetical protein
MRFITGLLVALCTVTAVGCGSDETSSVPPDAGGVDTKPKDTGEPPVDPPTCAELAVGCGSIALACPSDLTEAAKIPAPWCTSQYQGAFFSQVACGGYFAVVLPYAADTAQLLFFNEKTGELEGVMTRTFGKAKCNGASSTFVEPYPTEKCDDTAYKLGPNACPTGDSGTDVSDSSG